MLDSYSAGILSTDVHYLGIAKEDQRQPHLEASLMECLPSRLLSLGSCAHDTSLPSPRHARVSRAAAKSTFSLLNLHGHVHSCDRNIFSSMAL